MKLLRLILGFCLLATVAFGVRPKDEPTTITTPASDDFFLIDGATNGTNKTPSLLFVRTNGSYADPTWLTSLSASKLTGVTFTAGSGITITGAWPSLTFTAIGSSGNATSFQGIAVSSTAPTTGQVYQFNGTLWAPATVSGSAQVNSDWNAVSGVTQILNKPTLATVATTGLYSSLSGTPTIPAAQVNSDWNASSGLAQILNKPTIPAAQVAANLASASSTGVSGILPVANGGTGTATPGIVAGTNITVTGTWPTQTINASSGGGNATSLQSIALSATAPANNQVLTYNGSQWTPSPTPELIGFGVDGGGSVVTTGLRVKRVMPYAGTITGWSIVADQSGSITMDIRKGTPSGGAVTTSTITASATSALASQQVASSTTLTGWITTFAAGDVLEMVVTGTPVSVTAANLNLNISR